MATGSLGLSASEPPSVAQKRVVSVASFIVPKYSGGVAETTLISSEPSSFIVSVVASVKSSASTHSLPPASSSKSMTFSLYGLGKSTGSPECVWTKSNRSRTLFSHDPEVGDLRLI